MTLFISLVFVLALVVLEFYEIFWALSLAVVAALLLLQFGFEVGGFEFLKEAWKLLLVGAIPYLLVGLVWAYAKWFLWLKKEVKKAVATAKSYRTRMNPPKVEDHKGRIIHWMTFWPLSMVESVLGDFLRDLVRLFFEKVKQSFQKMANKIYESNQIDSPPDLK